MKALNRFLDGLADMAEAKAAQDWVTTGLLVVLVVLFFMLSGRLLWQLHQLGGL